MGTPRLAIKRIYEPAAAGDGLRILVDRIWPRGIAKTEAGLDDWCREIAPSTGLRRWFGHETERWEEFRKRYFSELRSNAAVETVEEAMKTGPVTLLYGAKDQVHNQAVALAEFLSGKGDRRGSASDESRTGRLGGHP